MSVGQLVELPVHTSAGSHASADGRHWVAEAAVTMPQVPSVAAPAATLQAWQSVVPPAHGVSQQTPSTQ